MALLHKSNWLQDSKPEQLYPGWHYKKLGRSIVIPEGQTVTFYENEDQKGFKSGTFYEGEYVDLTFYGVHEKHGVIHIEKCELKSQDMIQVEDDRYWTDDKGKRHTFVMIWKIPVGNRKEGVDFPNDVLDRLRIPFGVEVTVFENSNFDGGKLVFSGNTPDQYDLIKLSEFDYQNKISSMIVTSDDWVLAGIALEEESVSESNQEKIGATIELCNNSPHTATIQKEISCEFQESKEEAWEVGVNVGVKAGFEAETLGIKVTGEVSIEASAGYGQTESSSKAVEFTDVASVEIAGYGKAKVSMIIEYGSMECIAVRKWRNVRNNAIIEERGKIKFDVANKATVEVH